jgi:hypothetical protein
MRDPLGGLWDETYEFLRDMFSPYEKGFIELRYRKPNGSMDRNWFAVTEAEQAADCAYELDDSGCEVYFGVLPRDTNTDGRKANVSQAAWIWSDIDYKETSLTKATELLEKAPPDIRVKSGGGMHVYWKLNRVISLTDTGRKRFENALAKRIASVGGDPSAKDVSRILRVPGTLNRKYDPPRRVRKLVSPVINLESHVPSDTEEKWRENLRLARSKCEEEYCLLKLELYAATNNDEHLAAQKRLDDWRTAQARKRKGCVMHSDLVNAPVVIVETIPYIPPGEPVIFERKELDALDNYGPDAVRNVWNVKKHFGGKWIGAVEETTNAG